MGAELVLGPGAGAAGQELPLHLRGQGQPVLAAGLEVQVGVAFGHEHLVAEDLGDVGEFGDRVRVAGGGGQDDGQDAEPVAADRHREVCSYVPVAVFLHEGLLGAEGRPSGLVCTGMGSRVWGSTETGWSTVSP